MQATQINQAVEATEQAHRAKQIRLLTLREVMEKTAMGRTFIYNEMAEGRIRPVKMGRVLRFVEAEIDQWIADRIAAR